MDEQTFQSKFNELLDRISELPNEQRGRLAYLAEETKRRRDRIRASVSEPVPTLEGIGSKGRKVKRSKGRKGRRGEGAVIAEFSVAQGREPDRGDSGTTGFPVGSLHGFRSTMSGSSNRPRRVSPLGESSRLEVATPLRFDFSTL